MKNTFKLLASFALLVVSCSAMAQEDNKPAAQGYFKDKPSNVNQDKQLKELERSEQETYRPQPTPTQAPKETVPPQPKSEGKAKQE